MNLIGENVNIHVIEFVLLHVSAWEKVLGRIPKTVKRFPQILGIPKTARNDCHIRQVLIQVSYLSKLFIQS